MKRKALLVLACLCLTAPPVFAQQFVAGSQALKRWDSNGDGVVTLAELRSGRRIAFKRYDGDNNGVLTAAELAHVRPAGKGGRNALRDSPSLLDGNGDGAITRQEFVDGSGAWMKRMDGNGDGVLSAADFGVPRAKRRGNG